MNEILEAIVPLIEQGGTLAFWLAMLYMIIDPLKIILGFGGLILTIKPLAKAIQSFIPEVNAKCPKCKCVSKWSNYDCRWVEL